MEPLNATAVELVDEAIDFADELTIAVQRAEGSATVLDFGVALPGGLEAGLLLAEIATAGLATVQSTVEPVDGTPLTHAELTTDHPALALLCGARAGWEFSSETQEALLGGPARALVAEEPLFGRVGYQEESDFAVATVETDQLPDDELAAYVAEATGVPESAVFLAAHRTASVTGSVLAASRAAELATMRLVEAGYDPAAILSAAGRAPVAPVARDERTALARTTDAIAYGGEVHLTVEDPIERPGAAASTAADEFGVPLRTAFDDADWDFADVPAGVFAPAQVTVDVLGGPTHVVGERSGDVLAESFDHQAVSPVGPGE